MCNQSVRRGRTVDASRPSRAPRPTEPCAHPSRAKRISKPSLTNRRAVRPSKPSSRTAGPCICPSTRPCTRPCIRSTRALGRAYARHAHSAVLQPHGSVMPIKFSPCATNLCIATPNRGHVPTKPCTTTNRDARPSESCKTNIRDEPHEPPRRA